MKTLEQFELNSINKLRQAIEAELLIDKLAPDGLGLAGLSGELVLVPRALPGEKVWAEIRPGPGGLKRAEILKVLEASPYRRSVDCPLAELCGGCDFIQVRPEHSLRLKAQAALGPLAEGAGLELKLIQSPLAERYRHRATLHLGLSSNASPRLGFFDANRNILEINDCRLLDSGLNRLLPPLTEWAAEVAETLPGRGREIEVGLIKEVTGQRTAVCFNPPPPKHTWGEKTGQAALAGDFLAALADLPSFLVGRGLKDVSVFAKATRSASPRRISKEGPEHLNAAFWPQWNLALKVKPGGFTQVNPMVNMLLVNEIIKEAETLPIEKRSALDLYAGLGNISIPLAKSGFRVTAVEQAPEGAAAARKNGRGLNNFSMICGQSEKEAAALAKQGRRFGLIVLDPPRSGAKDMAPLLGGLQADKIIYVACRPAVLERDLPAFISLGYRLSKLAAFDMFPRTSHLEALAVLERD